MTIKAFVTSDDPSPDLTTVDATDMTLGQIEDRNSPAAETDIVFALKAQGNALFGAKVGFPLQIAINFPKIQFQFPGVRPRLIERRLMSIRAH